MASLTYPSGLIVSYQYNAVTEPQQVSSDDATPINYGMSATYAAHGGLGRLINNSAVSQYNYYDNRLRLQQTQALVSGTFMDLTFSYFANNNLQTVTDNRDNGRTVNYTYDQLNRLTSAQSQATSGADCWGQSIPSTGYDRYANLLTINASQCTAPTLNLSVNNANQVTNSGFSYDIVGNMLTDGVYTYAWDAEGRLTAANGMTYSYGGGGARLAKSPSGPLYWYGLGGEVLAETDTSGNTTNEYIYFWGSRIARRDASANVFYYFGDHLGTPRKITNSAGTVCYDADFYPFGGEKVFTNTCAQNYKFAQMERDTETGQDHTWFRQYSSNFGRWPSPDPMGGNILNPQSLNRYAYARNNPTTLTDPSGLDPTNSDLTRMMCLQFGNCPQRCDPFVNSACSGAPVGWDPFGLMNIPVMVDVPPQFLYEIPAGYVSSDLNADIYGAVDVYAVFDPVRVGNGLDLLLAGGGLFNFSTPGPSQPQQPGEPKNPTPIRPNLFHLGTRSS